jgi:alpha-tubulin suppressor-like RCC1 family protein
VATDLPNAVHYFFLTDNGEVFVWGYGILGKGPVVTHAREPTQIPSTLFGRNEFQPDSRIIAVSAGIGQLAAVSNHGDLYMWGHNRRGCLGLGNIQDQFFPLKVCTIIKQVF